MNSSIAFRWSIAVVLLVSIGWKIAVPPDNPSYSTEYLVKFLERNDFNVVLTDDVVNDTPVIRATIDSCQLQVARLTPDGSNRDLIRHLTASSDRSFVVFRGAVYAQQPIFWTVLDYLWSRFLRELGLAGHLSSIVHVAENLRCNAERLPWGQLKGPA